jgi:LmbE family N-acetylglucosaminyl deacetylase
MVVALTTETEWNSVLTEARPWTPPRSRMLVIAPHPDDETLAAGGLITTCTSQQQEVLVAAVTDGEHAYDDFPNLAQIRRGEQESALARLGVPSQDIRRFELPDSEVTSRESGLVERLLPLVSPATHIVAPWPKDFHPDHEVCGRAAQQVADETGAALTFYFFWTWHRGTPDLLQGLPLLALKLTVARQRAKMEALSEHRSQLRHHSGEPVLPDSLLWPARLPFEVFLSA